MSELSPDLANRIAESMCYIVLLYCAYQVILMGYTCQQRYRHPAFDWQCSLSKMMLVNL